MKLRDLKFDGSAHWEIHKDAIGQRDENTKYIRVRGTRPGGKFHIADVRFYLSNHVYTNQEDIDSQKWINERNQTEAKHIAHIIIRAPEMLEKLKKAEDALQGLFLPMKGSSAFIDAQSKCKETLKEITDLLNS